MNSLLALFWAFLKIGCTGYGGGPSMVPLIREETVNIHSWMTETEFIDSLAIGNALPGPIATKMSAIIGYNVAGVAGAAAATLATIIPGIIAILLLLRFVASFSNSPKVKSMLKGLRPVVVALLAVAAFDMVPSSLVNIQTWIIGLAALAVLVFTKIHPALLIVAGALAGIMLKL